MQNVQQGPQGFLTQAECQALFDRCLAMTRGGGEMVMRVHSEWTGSVAWGRSRAHTASDAHRVRIGIERSARGASGRSGTTRLDETGLRELVQRAEFAMQHSMDVLYDTRKIEIVEARARTPMLRPTLWSDKTYAFDGEQRGATVRQLIESAEAASLMASGELRVQAKSYSVFNSEGGPVRYYPVTRAVFSTTIRDKKNTGSGWAGTDDYDIGRIDMSGLAQRALEKCQRSVNPVALEPGRYTTILEPQAVADLFAGISGGAGWDFLIRKTAELDGMGPFADRRAKTKIGMRVFDPRVTWSTDPMDPIGGYLPFDHNELGVAYTPVKWVDGGILRELAYSRTYGLGMLGRENSLLSPHSWRVHGGSSSIDEMIATTKRGLLVTRFGRVNTRDRDTVTSTGFTRDGLWLIENGKITKPVKNFRFTESPFFAFNRIEQIGTPQRVFSESRENIGRDLAWVAPPIKVYDFNFTQLADAV